MERLSGYADFVLGSRKNRLTLSLFLDLSPSLIEEREQGEGREADDYSDGVNESTAMRHTGIR